MGDGDEYVIFTKNPFYSGGRGRFSSLIYFYKESKSAKSGGGGGGGG